MKPKVRWGVLGTGNLHDDPLQRVINSTTNAELIAISNHGDFNSYEELLNNPNIDIVYMKLPIHLYLEWTTKAARNHKHVLWEQPAALQDEEVKQVLDACQENNITFFESLMGDFHPQHKKVHELIKDQWIGDVKMVRVSFSYDPEFEERHACFHPNVGEGVLSDLGPACVNLIRHIFGGEPTSVVAHSVTDHHGAHLTVCGILNYSNHRCAVFDCSSDMIMRNEYEVIGTKGTIKASFANPLDGNKGTGILTVRTITGSFEITINDDPYINAVEHISACILSGAEHSSTGENTRNNRRVIDAVHTSLKNGSAVSRVKAMKRETDDWEAECGIAALFKR